MHPSGEAATLDAILEPIAPSVRKWASVVVVEGTESKSAGPYAWKNAIETLLPQARYFHKAGLISNYVLDVAYVEDDKLNVKFILSLAAHTGDGKVIGQMAKELTRWRLKQKAIPTTEEDCTQGH